MVNAALFLHTLEHIRITLIPYIRQASHEEANFMTPTAKCDAMESFFLIREREMAGR